MIAFGLVMAAGHATASAQIVQPWTDRVFVHVSGGAQTKARSYSVSGDFPLYGETATFDATMGTGNGSIVDVGGGIRLINNLGIAVTFSRYADGYSSPVNASIPDPLFFDQPHAASLSLDGLDQSERAVHISAAFMLPVTERLEVMIFGGPTAFSLKKDVVTDVTVTPGGTTLASAASRRVSASSAGVHIGADISYLAWRGPASLGLGVGLFLRHSAGSVDVSEVDGGNVDVGGFNYGAGVRIRF